MRPIMSFPLTNTLGLLKSFHAACITSPKRGLFCVIAMECLTCPSSFRLSLLLGFSTTTIRSSVSKPSTLPCSLISTMGQQGRQGACPPLSIRARKDAWTCASKCPPPPPVENGLLSFLLIAIVCIRSEFGFRAQRVVQYKNRRQPILH